MSSGRQSVAGHPLLHQDCCSEQKFLLFDIDLLSPRETGVSYRGEGDIAWPKDPTGRAEVIARGLGLVLDPTEDYKFVTMDCCFCNYEGNASDWGLLLLAALQRSRRVANGNAVYYTERRNRQKGGEIENIYIGVQNDVFYYDICQLSSFSLQLDSCSTLGVSVGPNEWEGFAGTRRGWDSADWYYHTKVLPLDELALQLILDRYLWKYDIISKYLCKERPSVTPLQSPLLLLPFCDLQLLIFPYLFRDLPSFVQGHLRAVHNSGLITFLRIPDTV